MTDVCTDVLTLTKQLIEIESHREAPGREGEIGRFLAEWFRDRGIDVDLQPVIDDRSNIIARIPGGTGPSLMLCGHLDTVPAGEMRDAFAPRVEDGILWGRGACDMKGAVAAMACALAETKSELESGRLALAGDLLFVGTADEETGGLGVKAVVDHGLRTDYAIVGEPTGMRVTLAHKGACFIRITLTGRGAHGSCPEAGVSAVSHAARVIRVLEEELRPRLAGRTHPLLGRSTLSVGRVCGGTQPNIVAERCEVDVDRRTVPGDDDPLGEIGAIVSELCGTVDQLSADVVEMPMTSVVPHAPLETSETSPIARAAMEAVAEIVGPDAAAPIGVTYWTDGGHLAANGMATVVLGPGDIAHAHGPLERVLIGELERAVQVYRRIVDRGLG